MALHEQCVGATDEWYTPPYFFEAFGCTFDLDPASPGQRVVPWLPATHHYKTDGLTREWFGLVWLNAPYGPRNGLIPWIDRFVRHSNGVMLTPDRTSAPWWQRWAQSMQLILFVSPKPKFIGVDGKPGVSPAQGCTLGAIGPRAIVALNRAADRGLGIALVQRPRAALMVAAGRAA